MITFSAAEHAKDSATAWDREDLKNFNAIVLYDMPMKITDVQKAKVLTLFGRGVGLVVLHHALVSFQDWPDYERIIGGRWPDYERIIGGRWPDYERIIGGRWPQPPKGQPKINDKVGYQHDVEVPVVITDKNHPVTSGLKDVSVRDEIYWGGGRVGKDEHPLLTTTHPKSGNPLMWTRTEGKSRIVFLQLGHDHSAFDNPNFRELLARSITWTTAGSFFAR